MHIKVNGHGGCEYDIEVNPSDTIWALKLKIYSESLGRPSKAHLLPPDDQTLVVLHPYGTELSECDRTMEFYGIHEGSAIACKWWDPRYPGEEGFRKHLDVFRKKERTSLHSVKATQGMAICIKHACCHMHEVRFLSLSSTGVCLPYIIHIIMSFF
jgi:hypothetical protein